MCSYLKFFFKTDNSKLNNEVNKMTDTSSMIAHFNHEFNLNHTKSMSLLFLLYKRTEEGYSQSLKK